jgi:hypothetical protein
MLNVIMQSVVMPSVVALSLLSNIRTGSGEAFKGQTLQLSPDEGRKFFNIGTCSDVIKLFTAASYEFL